MRFYDKYNSISNLPLYIWEEIHKTNKLSYLIKTKVEVKNCPQLASIWANIYNEYLLEFGLSEKYNDILNLKRQIAIKQAEYIITNDRILLTYINLDKENLKVLTKPIAKVSNFRENIINIEKIQGVKINPMNITVLEYFNYLKHLSNG